MLRDRSELATSFEKKTAADQILKLKSMRESLSGSIKALTESFDKLKEAPSDESSLTEFKRVYSEFRKVTIESLSLDVASQVGSVDFKSKVMGIF